MLLYVSMVGKIPVSSYQTQQTTGEKKRMSPKHKFIKECTPTYHNPPHPRTAIRYTWIKKWNSIIIFNIYIYIYTYIGYLVTGGQRTGSSFSRLSEVVGWIHLSFSVAWLFFGKLLHISIVTYLLIYLKCHQLMHWIIFLCLMEPWMPSLKFHAVWINISYNEGLLSATMYTLQYKVYLYTWSILCSIPCSGHEPSD